MNEPLLTRPFLLLVLGHFLQAVGYSSMLLLPLYVAHLGGSRTDVGLVMATASVGGLLLRPLVGWVLDAIGRRITVVVGTVVLTAGVGLIAVPDGLGFTLYGARFLVGIGAGTLFTAYFTFAADLIPPSRRTEGIALFGVSGLAPLLVTPIVGEFDLPPGDLRWVYVGVAVVIGLSLLAVLPLREPHRIARPADAPRVRSALWVAPLRPVWWATIVFAGLVSVYMAFSTVSAANRGVSRPAALWFAYAIAAVSVRLIGPRLPERVGPANIVAPALACYVGAFLVAAEAQTLSGFMWSGALAGVGHGYCFPVLTGQVVTRSADTVRGGALAAFTGLWELSALALTPAFGWLADRTDDATMLSGAGLFAVVGLAAWAALEARLGGGSAPPAVQRA